MFENKSLLSDIFISTDEGEKYIIFDHNDKTWVWPVNRLKAAIELYQPTTKQGKMLKQSIGFIKNNNKALLKAGYSVGKLKVDDLILDYIKELLNIDEGKYSIAAYMGDTTSEDNNKAVLQIYTDNQIVAYAKVTKSEKVTVNFEHEIQALEFLGEKEVKNLPQIIGADSVGKCNVMIQNTEKPINYKFKLEFDARHIEFISNITDKMKAVCSYEESEFYGDIQFLKSFIKTEYPKNERMIVNHSIKIIENQLQGKKNYYAFAHGDYSPWNIYYIEKEIRAFDFEYCRYLMPCYIDIFHYITQMSLLAMKNDGDQTIGIYEKNRKLLEKYIENTDLTYLCYLIYILSFYNKRTIGKFDIDDRQYRNWIVIISYLNSRLD